MLLESNSISKDVILMFDEMYLQKREEVNGDWLKEKIEGLLTNLHDIGFRVSNKQEL